MRTLKKNRAMLRRRISLGHVLEPVRLPESRQPRWMERALSEGWSAGRTAARGPATQAPISLDVGSSSCLNHPWLRAILR